MIEPGRKFVQGVKKYRYSINGQEKETELNENITTAEYWEYDSRLGRRWNVDPVRKEYESPYMAFADNPIWLTDYDGADTTPPKPASKYWYINNISEYKYNGKISDVPVENIPAAIGNGVIKVLNIVPLLWNSGVKNVQALREGIWMKGVGSEIKAGYDNASATVGNSIDYSINTPIKKQFIDFAHTIDDPNTLATGVSFWLSGKIPGAIGSAKDVNTLFHSTTTLSAADNILANGINPAYFNAESRFGKEFYLSTSSETTMAELKMHGSSTAATISFNLEKPILLNATGGALNLATHMAPKMMGMMARSFKMDGLMYNSVIPGASGTNVVLFKNFQKLTNGKRTK
jgi:hypothetical protein